VAGPRPLAARGELATGGEVTARSLTLRRGEETYELRLTGPDREGAVTLSGTRRHAGGAEPITQFHARAVQRDGEIELTTEEGVVRCMAARDGTGVWVSCRGRTAYLERASGSRARPAAAQSPDEVRAPMAGVLVEVRSAPGDRVAQGELLAVMEAMKMEYRLVAPRDGEVAEVAFAPGDRAELGSLVVRLA